MARVLVQVEKFGRQFEWDSEKAATNLSKHGVTFDEAVEALFDAFLEVAPIHRGGEDRLIGMGQTEKRKLLLVVHVERGTATRIISARRATNAERKAYEAGYRAG